jgi:ribosomal protein L11 methyltransferase
MSGKQGAGPDRAVRVILPEAEAEIVGAILMDRLGPFAQESIPVTSDDTGAARVILTFYPEVAGLLPATAEEVWALLPSQVVGPGGVAVEVSEVARDWEEGWKEHFHPIVIGRVRIRPPWESPDAAADLIDVVINPGLGFGTGLHPTTRGTLNLLQSGASEGAAEKTSTVRGPLVDAGTGSGILSIAAAKLGWVPIVAFDNDPVALIAAAENTQENGVADVVQLRETDIASADPKWFQQATVLANMTLDPVSALLRKLAADAAAVVADGSQGGRTTRRPKRLVVSGILAGDQERQLLQLAQTCGFVPGRFVYETEWVSLELFPAVEGS